MSTNEPSSATPSDPDDAHIENILSQARQRQKKLQDSDNAKAGEQQRVKRAKEAWGKLQAYRGIDADPEQQDALWERYIACIVELGVVLKTDGWEPSVFAVAPNGDVQTYGLTILRKAMDGDRAGVADLVNRGLGVYRDLGLPADEFLRGELQDLVLGKDEVEQRADNGSPATLGQLIALLDNNGSLSTESHAFQSTAARPQPHTSTMQGVDAIEVLCDEHFGGTGLTAQNVRQLRAKLCEWTIYSPATVNALSLEEFVAGLQCQAALAAKPQRSGSGFDRIMELGLEIHRTDCEVVPGVEPSVCPNADPPLPKACLPTVVKAFQRLGFLQAPGHTLHWIGVNAWRKNACKCFEGSDPTPAAAPDKSKVEFAAQSPRQPTPVRNTNTARDKFCYDSMAKGKTRAWIRNRIKPEWERLESEQGVSAAAKRHAKRHNLLWPISRAN